MAVSRLCCVCVACIGMQNRGGNRTLVFVCLGLCSCVFLWRFGQDTVTFSTVHRDLLSRTTLSHTGFFPLVGLSSRGSHRPHSVLEQPAPQMLDQHCQSIGKPSVQMQSIYSVACFCVLPQNKSSTPDKHLMHLRMARACKTTGALAWVPTPPHPTSAYFAWCRGRSNGLAYHRQGLWYDYACALANARDVAWMAKELFCEVLIDPTCVLHFL